MNAGIRHLSWIAALSSLPACSYRVHLPDGGVSYNRTIQENEGTAVLLQASRDLGCPRDDVVVRRALFTKSHSVTACGMTARYLCERRFEGEFDVYIECNRTE